MDVRVGLAQARLRVAVEHARRRPRRRVWVTDVLQRRKARGEFYHLVQELRLLDPDRHQTYFRMSRDSFDLILSKIGPMITRQHTNFREPIEPAQRLAITLRYLASGMEFAALAPTYRLGERTVRAIVWDTSGAPPRVDGTEAEQANGGGGGALVDLRGRLAAHPHNYPVRAEQIRQQFTHFFMGPGAVPWQE
ncbi:Protein ALP1-like [Amphibalanus amphitrite]|uniref:Protein ALP1-like n=1 Tax=Amphibalanus amphitrite TaxID=1232801 RepID=A0A6A4VWB7_AMPAM|nr:Protein ALP1-like [Amphibalanus amphitrite]